MLRETVPLTVRQNWKEKAKKSSRAVALATWPSSRGIAVCSCASEAAGSEASPAANSSRAK